MIQVHQSVEQLIKDWAEAELKGDVEALNKMFVESYVGVGPFGFMLTKQQWLDRHSRGDLKYSAFSVEDIKSRVYDDFAIVIAHQKSKAICKGKSFPGNFRITLVLLNKEGSWLIAGQHLSMISRFNETKEASDVTSQKAEFYVI